MAVETADIAARAGHHFVHFYGDESELVDAVNSYLVAAIRAGEASVVIATETHRREFQIELAAAGIDLSQEGWCGRLTLLDAATTLASFVVDGRIDRGAFRQVVGGIMRDAAEAGRPVRAYGEMVALLWSKGDVMAAIDLESLWNELLAELPFSLFCAYPTASVSASEHSEALQQVCHLHSSVIHSPDRDGDGGYPERGEVAEFAPALDAPGAARHFVVDALHTWGYEGTLVDDAALVVTELATNAVLHAGSHFSVDVRPDGSGVRISVRDASPVVPSVGNDLLMALSGRGLFLVAELASGWGVDIRAHGKIVWAVLAGEGMTPG
ncbi:MAG: sensor histidine kinase [Acidimicrobiaceae bacterium]|nr:sensor histidine kinase [Acidimicrobiaceae bacterium]